MFKVKSMCVIPSVCKHSAININWAVATNSDQVGWGRDFEWIVSLSFHDLFLLLCILSLNCKIVNLLTVLISMAILESGNCQQIEWIIFKKNKKSDLPTWNRTRINSSINWVVDYLMPNRIVRQKSTTR